MIEINEIFSDSDKRLAWWCESVSDTNDLATHLIVADNSNVAPSVKAATAVAKSSYTALKV